MSVCRMTKRIAVLTAPTTSSPEGREQLGPGVEEVESFDENQIVMYTTKGTLVVRGETCTYGEAEPDGGDLKVEGDIDALTYEDGPREKGGLFPALPPRGRPLKFQSRPRPSRWRAPWRWGWRWACCTTCFAFCGCASPGGLWAASWTWCSGCW